MTFLSQAYRFELHLGESECQNSVLFNFLAWWHKMIHFKVKLKDLSSHCFEVTMVLPHALEKQMLRMPAWIPGSYLIRDFAKQLSNLTIINPETNQPITFEQTKSNEWIVNTTGQHALTITYSIYAFDKSVRGAFLNSERGFFNGTSLFLCPIGFENEAYQLDIEAPKNKDWQVVTGLACGQGTNRYDFGCYQAKNYAELMDCPVSVGTLKIVSFTVAGVPHDIAISGHQEGDLDKLAKDVQAICETQVKFFQGLPKEVSYYCFLLHVSHEGYGGLEHVNSCSLLINKFALPTENGKGIAQVKAYQDLLGLFSHEYFHLWMVKQIKPVILMNPDLTQPNYTTQLWAFEGFTSYYDDLMLVRAGLITPEQYFAILADNINRLLKTPGRKYQTLKSASFDAWIKFYKPDENSINSTVSYYLKGALLALCCDLKLRNASAQVQNLDNIIRKLWQEYGLVKRGLEENEIQALLLASNQEALENLLIQGLEHTTELPIDSIFKDFGLDLKINFNDQMLDLGAKLVEYQGMLLCQEIYEEGVLKALGVEAGDSLVACQGNKITQQNHQALFQSYLNQNITITIFREDKLKVLTGCMPALFMKQVEIKTLPGAEKYINQWLFAK